MFARLFRAAALLLFAGRAIVVQAHLHAPTGGRQAVSAMARASGPQQQRREPVDCPVCREVAHAGQYLSPGPVVVPPPVVLATWRAAAALPILGIDRHSHAWRSRAPPASRLS